MFRNWLIIGGRSAAVVVALCVTATRLLAEEPQEIVKLAEQPDNNDGLRSYSEPWGASRPDSSPRRRSSWSASRCSSTSL